MTMNPDVYLEILLILLCMYFAYKWKQEKLMHEHYKSMYEDKVDLLQTYKHIITLDKKRVTRMQNELNRVGNLYLKMKKEYENKH
jgi:hypothetical protein